MSKISSSKTVSNYPMSNPAAGTGPPPCVSVIVKVVNAIINSKK